VSVIGNKELTAKLVVYRWMDLL